MKLNLNHTSETQLNPFVAFWDFWRSLPYPRAGDKNIFVAFLSFYFFLSLFFFEFIYSQSLHCFIFCTICYLYVCMRILLFSVCFYSCSNTRYSLRSIFFVIHLLCVYFYVCVWMCIYGFRESVCCFVYTFKWCAVVIDRIAIFVCLLCIFFVIV